MLDVRLPELERLSILRPCRPFFITGRIGCSSTLATATSRCTYMCNEKIGWQSFGWNLSGSPEVVDSVGRRSWTSNVLWRIIKTS